MGEQYIFLHPVLVPIFISLSSVFLVTMEQGRGSSGADAVSNSLPEICKPDEKKPNENETFECYLLHNVFL